MATKNRSLRKTKPSNIGRKKKTTTTPKIIIKK
jgi:hypothetical protein